MMGFIKTSHKIILLIILIIENAAPGPNDLHFSEGVTSADIIADDIFFEILDPQELGYTYRVRPAKDFGAPFNESVQFKKAHLVPTIPLQGCTEIVNQDELFGQIALAERGECSFVLKTLMAQQAGARAIIVTESSSKDDDALELLIEMVDDKKQLEVNIPAGFLLGRNGAKILRTLKQMRRKHAVVNLPVNLTYVPLTKMKQPPWILW